MQDFIFLKPRQLRSNQTAYIEENRISFGVWVFSDINIRRTAKEGGGGGGGGGADGLKTSRCYM